MRDKNSLRLTHFSSVTAVYYLSLSCRVHQVLWRPFVITHTFCASRDGPRHSSFLRNLPTNTKVFLRGL